MSEKLVQELVESINRLAATDPQGPAVGERVNAVFTKDKSSPPPRSAKSLRRRARPSSTTRPWSNRSTRCVRRRRSRPPTTGASFRFWTASATRLCWQAGRRTRLCDPRSFRSSRRWQASSRRSTPCKIWTSRSSRSNPQFMACMAISQTTAAIISIAGARATTAKPSD
jgi:hypothetical protein